MSKNLNIIAHTTFFWTVVLLSFLLYGWHIEPPMTEDAKLQEAKKIVADYVFKKEK